jgi:hypothetical protein
MTGRFGVLIAAIAALLAAVPSAQAASSPVPNGTYGYAASSFADGGPMIIFQATVKGNRITGGNLFQQPWSAITGNVFADNGPPVITKYKATTISSKARSSSAARARSPATPGPRRRGA